MDIEKTLIEAMSFITNTQPTPPDIAKQLVIKLCLYRAQSKWLQKILSDILVETYAISDKADRLKDSVAGTFDEEDDLFLKAYTACGGNKTQDIKLTKNSLIVVKGGKNEKC